MKFIWFVGKTIILEELVFLARPISLELGYTGEYKFSAKYCNIRIVNNIIRHVIISGQMLLWHSISGH